MMHGRVKVRTTQELQAIKKKEEEGKAIEYETKMNTILKKKKNGWYDDEILSFTSDVIYLNPDVLTVWNARKEYLLKLKQTGAGVTQDHIDTELKLTEAGLKINPKSYCAWYHRLWLLDNFADEFAWNRELKLCSKYLELDDRNFHCWDYRRYVVERQRTQIGSELEYSMQKLASNFSNYSAWHYRSKLIPRFHPTFKKRNLFDNKIYLNEISLVENAVYTDPNDQSAWFYHQWLLGQIITQPRFIQAGYCNNIEKCWVVVYPRQPSNVVKGLNELPWEYLDGNKCSNILVKSVNKEFSGEITLFEDDGILDTIYVNSNYIHKMPINFKTVLNEKEDEILRQQLQSYKTLLQLEPNNKWALLTIVILKDKLGDDIDTAILDKLSLIDENRRSYYLNLKCRYQLEKVLSNVTNWHGTFVFSNHDLNALYHIYCFSLFQQIDLRGNPLGNDLIPNLSALLSCKVLILSNCKITSIDNFPPLPNLRSLDLSMNEICCSSLPVGFLKCVSLEYVDLTKNNVPSNVGMTNASLSYLTIIV